MPAAQPLSREDLNILALENATVAGHTCKVILVQGQLGAGELRASIAGRLDHAPRLCLRLAERDGQPWWVPDPDLDLTAHVVESVAAGAGDDAALRAAVAGIFAQHLDRSRPLWRIDVIPGLAGDRSAVIWRIHHALADGMTAMAMARAVLWDDAPDRPPGHRPGRRPRPAGAGGRDGPHLVGDLRTAVREAPQPWQRSPFDGHIDARRSVAFSTAGLAALRRVGHATGGATVNDAVLTVVAGGLHRWLEAQHGHLGAVRVKVPVSLHNATGHDGAGNRDSFFCLDLPLGAADPLARLAAIHHATKVRKQGHDAQHLDACMRQLARVPPLGHVAERVLSHARSFALNVSNVPGPRQPVRLLGRPVVAMYSLAEIGTHHALRIAVVSLADTLNFGLVADPTLLDDVDQLAAGLQAEAAALCACLPPG